MPPSISVIEPVGKAINWVGRVLFRPFDLSKWFVIGFCAWLAFLGEGGGSGLNFPGGGGGGRGPGSRGFQHEAEQVRDFVVSNLYWILPVVAFTLLLVVAISLLFAWLSSRGKFMFLFCVAADRAEVALPWRRYSVEADNLFVLRIVLWLAGFFVMLGLVFLALFAIYRMALEGAASPLGIAVAVTAFGSFLVFLFAFLLIGKVIEDFLVPIMFIRGSGWRRAASELMGLASGNLGVFILYILFQILISIVIGLIVLTLVFATCCIAGCILIIPYLGTVLLLPFLVFQRAYSLLFLAQFGREYDAFSHAAANPL